MLTHVESSSDYKDKLYNECISFIVYLIFLIVMPIIATNLLTGLAIDDIAKIRGIAESKRMAMLIDKALQLEFLMLEYKGCWFIGKYIKSIRNKGIISHLVVKKEHGGFFTSANYLDKRIDIDDLTALIEDPLSLPHQDENAGDKKQFESLQELKDKQMKHERIMDEVGFLREDVEDMQKNVEDMNAILKKLQEKLLKE